MSIINYDSVLAAVEEIRASGQRPTNRAIQTKLGGGSLSTIHGHLKTILAETPEIPVNISDALHPLMETGAALIRQTLTEAEKFNQDRIKGLEEDLDVFSKDLAAAKVEAEMYVNEIGRLGAERNQLESELKLCKESWQKDKEELKEVRSNLARIENRQEDFEKAQNDLAAARKEIEAHIKVSSRLEAQVEDRDKEIEELKQENRKLKTELENSKKEVNQLIGRIEEREEGKKIVSTSAGSGQAESPYPAEQEQEQGEQSNKSIGPKRKKI
jgi:chromosome segregation ATPase